MDALSIAIAFITLLIPGAVVFFGIKWSARRRARAHADRAREIAEQDERLAGMARMRQPSLRVIGRHE